MIKDFLIAIGVKPLDLAAGFAGGLVNALAFGERNDPWGAAGSVLMGALTASYLGPAGPAYFNITPSPAVSGALSFLVGLLSMAICRRALNYVSQVKIKGQQDDPSKK